MYIAELHGGHEAYTTVVQTRAPDACRPEQHIAVVTHCGFLFYLLSSFGHECAQPVAYILHKAFDNCELRSVVISDAAGPSRPDPTYFPGGRGWLGTVAGPKSHP